MWNPHLDNISNVETGSFFFFSGKTYAHFEFVGSNMYKTFWLNSRYIVSPRHLSEYRVLWPFVGHYFPTFSTTELWTPPIFTTEKLCLSAFSHVTGLLPVNVINCEKFHQVFSIAQCLHLHFFVISRPVLCFLFKEIIFFYIWRIVFVLFSVCKYESQFLDH